MPNQRPNAFVRPRHGGYTLAEVVVASASATILLGGLTSAVYISSQALSVGSGSLAEKRAASEALALINRDLQSALTLSELSSRAVTMNVPDRNGDGAPETIRYQWSGIVGDPLTQQYNGQTATNLATNVQAFSLAYDTRLIRGANPKPVVLFISGQAPTDTAVGTTDPSSSEQERIDLINSWDYNTTVLSDQATQEQLDAEVANATVVYVPSTIDPATLGTKLNGVAIGIVTELRAYAATLGFFESLLFPISQSGTAIELTNNTHYITETFALGSLTVSDSNLEITASFTSFTNEAATLAVDSPLLEFPSLGTLDAGDALGDDSPAAGRRCLLPWGEGAFAATQLNVDGQTVMQRSLEWAAGAGQDTETTQVGVVYEEFTEAQVSSNQDSLQVDVPAGVSDGDLLIMVAAIDGDVTGAMQTPANWNLLHLQSGDGAVTSGVYWKLAASEPSQYTVTWGSGQEAYVWMMRFTGHDSANPIHDFATDDGRSSSPTTPNVTTTIDNAMILHVGAFDDDDVTANDTGISGHTDITMDESGSGSGTASGGAAYVTQATAGDSGSVDFDINGSEQYVTVTIAIAPAP